MRDLKTINLGKGGVEVRQGKILCVCSGNTCRSPMLAVLLRAALDRRGLHGIFVESAGILPEAEAGNPATVHAITCMAERGLDLRSHRSRGIRSIDLLTYDLFYCMKAEHADKLRRLCVPSGRIMIVNAEEGGVPDPFGGDIKQYRACAEVLARAAEAIAAGLEAR